MDFIKQIIKQIVDKLFCCHRYKLFKEIRVDNTGIDYDGSRYSIYIFKCEKCGKFKKVKSLMK